MAAVRDLVTNYLRQAADETDGSVDAMIAWLDTERQTLWTEVKGGDWEVSSGSFEGQSHSSRRGVSARELLDAVNAALDQLKKENGAGGGLLNARFWNTPL